MKLTDEEIDQLYVQMTGKTRWEEATASAMILGSGLLLVIGILVAAAIILIAD